MRRLSVEDHSTLMGGVVVLCGPLTNAHVGEGGQIAQRSSGSISSSIGSGASAQ